MNRTCGSSKPTPTPLNGLAFEARKKAKKVIEGDADTIRRQTTRQNLPRTASVAGGARRKRRYGKTSHRQNPPAYRQRGGGGRDEEKRIEGEHRREGKGNQSQNPPATITVSNKIRPACVAPHVIETEKKTYRLPTTRYRLKK